MNDQSIKISVIMDDKIFRRFTIFDNIYRKRIWVSPVIFATIMSAFALVCFVMRGRADGAVMIGCVLLIIGLGLPAAFMRVLFKSTEAQIKAMGLERARPVYSLRLSREPDGVQVTNGGELTGHVEYEWGGMFGAYRVHGCTYLYVKSNKAFLLPDEQAEGGSDIWSLLIDMLPKEKLHDCRFRFFKVLLHAFICLV